MLASLYNVNLFLCRTFFNRTTKNGKGKRMLKHVRANYIQIYFFINQRRNVKDVSIASKLSLHAFVLFLELHF